MSEVLDAFWLLDFTMLWPVLTWRAFLKLLNVYFFNFPYFFQAAGNRGYGGSPVHVGSWKLASLYLII